MSESASIKPKSAGKKLFLVICLVFGLLAVCGLASVLLRNYFADQAVKAELAKAKAAGMLTTLDDVKKFIGPAPEKSQNAAPFYRQMTELKSSKFGNMEEIWSDLFRAPTSRTIEEAKELLLDNLEIVRLAEQAADREFCFFDHDWRLGHGLTFPHVAPAKMASRLLLIRAFVSNYEKREADAVMDIRRVMTISRHLALDKVPITFLVSSSITDLAVKTSAHFAAKDPPGSDWYKELANIEESIVAPTFREVVATDLYLDLVMFEAVKTEKSRTENLGFQDDEKPEPQHELMASMISEQDGKRAVISGRLKVWNELEEIESVDWSVVDQGLASVAQGYLSDPYLIMIQQGLSIGELEYIRTPRERILETKLLVQAALRVLRQSDRSKLPDFSDLVSPADSQPVSGKVVANKVVLTISSSSTHSESDKKLEFSISK